MDSDQIKTSQRDRNALSGLGTFDSETVLGNVMFPLMMFGDMSPAEQRERAEFCLERVNLHGAGHKYPAEISGGMQKRVAIARAIALNPKYLFLR